MTHRESKRAETARQSAETRDVEVGLPPADCVDALRFDLNALFEHVRLITESLQANDVIDDRFETPWPSIDG